MNRDDIIRMAREAIPESAAFELKGHYEIERFAALVAAHEREECAVAAKKFLQDGSGHGEFLGNLLAQHIRERGEKA